MSGKSSNLDPDLRVVVTGLKRWERRLAELFADRAQAEQATEELERRLKRVERDLKRLQRELKQTRKSRG